MFLENYESKETIYEPSNYFFENIRKEFGIRNKIPTLKNKKDFDIKFKKSINIKFNEEKQNSLFQED
jgi:hypothetical protein